MNANILTDPCIRVRLLDGRTELLSLPGVMAALVRNEVESFPGLRAHQAHPWHAFLCQLAAMALEGDELPPVDPARPETFLGDLSEEEWRGKLRALTPEFPQDEPWTLVVEDVSKPAFMQPPCIGDAREVLNGKNQVASPGAIDVLISSKCHGVKQASIENPSYDDWIFALISIQTHAQYVVQYNSSIRQNSRVGSRPCAKLSTSMLPGLEFCRDTMIIHDSDNFYYHSGLDYDINGLKLVWVSPWDGVKTLEIENLHPLFIECTRIIRLITEGLNIYAFKKSTSSMRITGVKRRGNVGDPWIPIVNAADPEKSKAFNSKLDYVSMSEVMFDINKYRRSLLQQAHKIDHKFHHAIYFQGFQRGKKGKSGTNGIEFRRIPIPPKQVNFLNQYQDKAAEMSRSMVRLAKEIETEVLLPAVTLLMQSARKAVDKKQKETNTWARRIVDDLDRVVDERFFPFLWECLDRWNADPSITAALSPWREFLLAEARRHFERATNTLPTSSAMRIAAIAKAEGLFWANARKCKFTSQQEGEPSAKRRARSRKDQ